MTRPTLHVLLDLPAGDTLIDHIGPDDAILDLSFITPPGPLKRAILERHPSVDWIAHAMSNAETFQRVRHDYLHALTELANRPIIDDISLKSLFTYDDGTIDGVSLWWFTDTSERRFRIHPLPQLLMRRWWLLHAQGKPLLIHTHQTYPKWSIWSNDPQVTAQWIEQLRTLGITTTTPSSFDANTGHPTTPAILTKAAHLKQRPAWRVLRTRSKALWRHLKLIRAHQTIAKRHHNKHPKGVDILVATFASGWSHPDNATPKHRYFEDVVATLHNEDDKHIAWLPAALLTSSLPGLERALDEHNTPTAWQALTLSMRDVRQIDQRLNTARRLFDQLLPRLWHHPNLEIFGLDISPWLLPDLAHVLDTEGMKFMLLKTMIERTCATLRPQLLLYRDEFYTLGRAISAANTPGVPKWSMQHGLITEDHWTYLYTKTECDPPHQLPTPDSFLTYGTYAQELMTQWGYSKDTRPIGSLRHDDMLARAHLNAPINARSRAQLNLPPDQPVCLICTQLIAQIPGWIERLVHALRHANIQAHIAIKQHHFHRADALIDSTFKHLNWSNYSVHTQHLEALLHHADVALTENSTTGVEALIWHTPLICYNEPDRYESFPYVTHGGALSGEDVPTMAQSLLQVLSNTHTTTRDAFLSKHLQNTQHPTMDTLRQHLNTLPVKKKS